MSDMDSDEPQEGPPTAGRADTVRRGASFLFAFLGLSISGYLAWLSLTGRVAPGCGSGAGCGEVLGSRWSAIGPVPVSVPAALGYLTILALLLFRPGANALRACLLGAMGAMLLGAAVWYIALQQFLIGVWCPYCLAGHGVGVLLGLVLLSAVPMKRMALPAAGGLVGVLLLIGLQVAVPASGKSVALPSEGDYDMTDDAGRHLGLIGGKLRLDANSTPHHGPTDGDRPIVLLLDYGCPHCRAAHEMLADEMGRREGLVVFALPTSLHEDHNPYIALDYERFANSYELALLSLAVWRDAPEQWPAFDRWLFEGSEVLDGEFAWPRNLPAAEAYAAELIGEVAAAGAYDDPGLVARVEANIQTIGEVLAASPFAVPGLPIVMAPHASGAIYGRFDDAGLLDAILDDARENR